MLHSPLWCFPGPFIVSTLALWSFESFCILLFSSWAPLGGVRFRKRKKKKNRHLFLVVVLPCASAASPAVSYPLLCSLLLKCLLPLLYKLPHRFSSKGFHWSALDFQELVDSKRPQSFRGSWVCMPCCSNVERFRRALHNYSLV